MLQNQGAKGKSSTPLLCPGLGRHHHVRHIQPACCTAKGRQISVDGRDDQRLVSRRGIIPWAALHGVCPKVYIVGTDQPESDWFTLFKREGLVTSDGELGGPVEMLWHTGAPLHLTDEGISHLGEIAAENPRSLFLLDSYHACCAVLGLEEAASSFDGPARKLAEALAPHKATLAMIHHTNKSVSGGNATQASRGSNALPAAASLTILMNWFKQPAEGQTQNDHRVVVKTQGRAKGTTLLIELQDDGWIHHGDGESVLAAEAMQEAADELQGRQATSLITSASVGCLASSLSRPRSCRTLATAT